MTSLSSSTSRGISSSARLSDLPVGLPFSRDLPEEIGAGESADVSWSDRPHGLRLDPATGANESIVATGFWFLGEWVHSPVDIRQDEADRFENMIDVYRRRSWA